MGAAINVGNITLSDTVTVNFTANANTFATNGAVRTIDLGAGATFDFNGQQISTAAGTGFTISGTGIFGTGVFSNTNNAQSFTLNSGTVIARGTTGLGNGSNSVLNLNGGVLASNASRNFDNTRFGGGIVIGGNLQFGALATEISLASSSANLSFANNVSLGNATRTLTQGNNGTHTFSGIISNTSGGISFAANFNTDGRFDVTNEANSFHGDIHMNGGEVRFSSDGSLGNSGNDIIIDGGRFGIASGASVTIGTDRQILVGDATGTSISTPGASGSLTYNGAIANKTGETGTWAKQGQGTLVLGGVSTYTGNTDINNGTVRLTTGNDRLPTGTVVSMGQSASTNLGTLDMNGYHQQIAGLNSTVGTNATSGNNTVTTSSAATLTLGGSGNYSFGDTTNVNSGVITGAISLVKQGGGTQTFGDANTYTGTTTIAEGTLVINGDQSAATGDVSVTGTLAGTGGTVGGKTTLHGGGHLAVGDGTAGSTGTLTFTKDLTFASASLFDWDLNAATSDTGTNNQGAYDKVVANGGLGTMTGTAVFTIGLVGNNFTDAFWDSHKTWTDIFSGNALPTNLATIFSSFGGTGVSSNGTVSGQGQFSINGSTTLTWTAIPELSNSLIGGLIGLGLLRRRRKASGA